MSALCVHVHIYGFTRSRFMVGFTWSLLVIHYSQRDSFSRDLGRDLNLQWNRVKFKEIDKGLLFGPTTN